MDKAVSPFSVDETMRRIEEIIKSQGGSVFAVFDHGRNASEVGMKLPPNKVIVFGLAESRDFIDAARSIYLFGAAATYLRLGRCGRQGLDRFPESGDDRLRIRDGKQRRHREDARGRNEYRE